MVDYRQEFRLSIVGELNSNVDIPDFRLLDVSKPLFSIGVGDVDQFIWRDQTIVLTPEATYNLENTAISGMTEKALAAAELHRQVGTSCELEMALYHRIFVVSCQSRFCYAGIFLHKESSWALNMPVIRVGWSLNKGVFHILPSHIPFRVCDSADQFIQTFPDETLDQYDDAARGAMDFHPIMRASCLHRAFESSGKISRQTWSDHRAAIQ